MNTELDSLIGDLERLIGAATDCLVTLRTRRSFDRLEKALSTNAMADAKPSEPELVMTQTEVCALLRTSPRMLSQAVERAEFPAPKRLGKKCIRWVRCEVEQWISTGKSAFPE